MHLYVKESLLVENSPRAILACPTMKHLLFQFWKAKKKIAAFPQFILITTCGSSV